MGKKIVRPLALGFAAETKHGKSHLAAQFAKEFGGIVLDFSRVFMKGGFTGETPSYETAQKPPVAVADGEEIEVGEAYPACENVGLNTDSCYKLILEWKDFENAIAYARFYRDDILNKRKCWLVLDDMVGLRWHRVINIAMNAKPKPHKSVAKDDWKIASSDIKLLISQLSKEFNILMVNQMGDAYESGEKTGMRDPVWIPSGAQYLYDGIFYLKIDETQAQRVQYAELIAGRNVWQCSSEFVPRINNPTPEKILDAFNISKDRW